MKTMKKTMLSIVSFLLSVTMMLTVFVIPVYADEPEPEDVTIHYYNEGNWQSPYLYYYADNNTPVVWPGVAMTSEGDNWYSYTVSNYDEIRVIFSDNGANQYPAQNEPGILVSGEKWFKNGNLYSQNPDTFNVTVHYYNGRGWSSPYIYYYDTNTNPVSWPGAAMTSDGDGWYSYVINGFDSVRVIFSDNGSNQTPAQNEPGYLVSGEKWFVGSTAYDSEPDGITVHFYNYNNWSNVNIYYYIGELTGPQWTGLPMNAEGDGWYSYKLFDFDEARVIFNNGNGTQIPAPMQEGFYVDEDSWYRNGTWTSSRPQDIVVYFYKPTGWNTPNIYYYLNNNDTGPAWPGTAMTEISDGWYAASVSKYSSAKVMFNDGTNQIPSQNQPGLDAEGIMWYKNGIWCDSETDTDEDDLPDYMELLLGTNISNTDSDSDGLPDGFEALTLGTDPTLADTDGNDVSDANEDADSDGLTNLREYQLGTDPTVADSDNDGLTDGAEVNTHLTDPADEDTDGDGASDGWEVEHSFDPLVVNSSFDVTLSLGFRDDDVAPGVSIELDGDQADSLQIEQITDNRYYLEETAGIVGSPYSFEVSGIFDSAEISFEFDSDLLLDEDFDPVICWFDEENQKIELLDTDVVGNVATAEVEHFSVYMLIDGTVFSDAFFWEAKYTVSDICDKLELAVLIDDSTRMLTEDPDDQRMSIINQICAGLPSNSTMGVYRINADGSTSIADDHGHILTVSVLFASNLIGMIPFDSSGTIDTVYASISNSPCCFTEDDPLDPQVIKRVVIVISDGKNPDTENRTAAMQALQNAGATLVFIGIGEDEDIPGDLRTFAYETGGRYLNWTRYQDMVNDPEDYVSFEMDHDLDGLPDEFEGTITLFNGKKLYSNPLDPDTDDDGLPDGEEVEISRYYRNNRTQVAVFAFLHSNPNSADGDGDGILDSDDYWEANPIWSDDNPADLRYQALNPLIRNTLETMYPEINEKYNENNAKRVHLVDNTIYIDCNVCFSTNDAFDDFNTGYEGLPIDDYYNNSFTYAQVIEIAIENAWSTLVYGSDFDFVKGMEIRIITNIIPIDSIYDYEFVEIDVNNQFPGTPHTFHRNNVWKYDSTSTIYLQKWDNRNLGLSTSPLTADQYMRVAAHEFGHVLGICDAYLDNDDKLLLGCTSETYAGRESNKSDSNIMYNNGYVYANDIEMVLEAFSTNEYQYYIERHNTDFLFYKLGYQSKSNVIRQNQRFVDEYHVGVFTL